MNAPRPEVEARREKMRTIDRATEQLLAFEFPLTTRAKEDMHGLMRTMWPLFVAEVIESKELSAKLTFEVVLTVKDGVPQIAVEVASKGEPRAVPIWKVHVYVCGKHAGFYEFKDRAEAIADMEQRKRDYGILRCSYLLEEPNAQVCHERSE